MASPSGQSSQIPKARQERVLRGIQGPSIPVALNETANDVRIVSLPGVTARATAASVFPCFFVLYNDLSRKLQGRDLTCFSFTLQGHSAPRAAHSRRKHVHRRKRRWLQERGECARGEGSAASMCCKYCHWSPRRPGWLLRLCFCEGGGLCGAVIWGLYQKALG